MKRWAIATAALLAVNWIPSPALAGGMSSEVGTVVATVVGVVAGGVIASAVATGTTATVVGAAVGGGIACWWYDGGDGANVEALPRKTAVRTVPAAHQQSEIVPIASPELRLVAAKR
jgi:hypothetical protein